MTIARNELDVNILTAEYKDVFELEEMQSNNYSMASFERGYISKQMSLLDLNVEHVKLLEQNIDKIGNFKFDFYFVKSSKSDIRTENSDAKYPYRLFSPTHRRSWLKRNIGVKIYRDGFRV